MSDLQIALLLEMIHEKFDQALDSASEEILKRRGIEITQDTNLYLEEMEPLHNAVEWISQWSVRLSRPKN